MASAHCVPCHKRNERASVAHPWTSEEAYRQGSGYGLAMLKNRVWADMALYQGMKHARVRQTNFLKYDCRSKANVRAIISLLYDHFTATVVPWAQAVLHACMQIYNVIVLFVIYWRNLLHLAITPRTSLSLSSDDPKIAYVCLCCKP